MVTLIASDRLADSGFIARHVENIIRDLERESERLRIPRECGELFRFRPRKQRTRADGSAEKSSCLTEVHLPQALERNLLSL